MSYEPEPACDVAAASAALLVNLWPDLVKLPAKDRFRRCREIIESSIYAYCELVGGRVFLPEPSLN